MPNLENELRETREVGTIARLATSMLNSPENAGLSLAEQRCRGVARSSGNMSGVRLSSPWILGAGLAILLCGATGCRMLWCGGAGRSPDPLELSLPLWLTAPSGDEQRETPVLLGMELPPDLTPFGERFASLPPWYVYGTVRCLGAEELLAIGTVRTYSRHDGMAEYRHVVDTLRYHVDAQRVEMALSAATQAVAQAKSDGDRWAFLKANLRYRHSGFGLFRLAGVGNAEEDAGGSETFREGVPPAGEPVGWRETAAEFLVTQAGDFRYSDPVGALRRTEEDAIAELARGTLLRLAHLQKDLGGEGEVIRENITKETFWLRIKGVRVLRRSVDLSDGTCRVTISVPKSGVSRVK